MPQTSDTSPPDFEDLRQTADAFTCQAHADVFARFEKLQESASQHGDNSFTDYRAQCQEKLQEAVTTQTSHKYEVFYVNAEHMRVSAAHYPGLTIIAEPYPLLEDNIRADLAVLQNKLIQVPGFVPVPASSFHMTIADLISGEAFDPTTSGAIRQEIEPILTRWNRDCDVLHGHIIGLSTFPGCVIAIVDFTQQSAYERIIALRDALYVNTKLARLNITRPPYPFQGHVTLGYLLTPPTGRLRQVIESHRIFNRPYKFDIRGAGLYAFANMSAYMLSEHQDEATAKPFNN
jgi:2'-5' RNA ligase